LAVDYLADLTLKTMEATAHRATGAVHCSPELRSAVYSSDCYGRGPLLGLRDLTGSSHAREMLKQCVVQVASQKRPRRVMKINLLKTIDGDGRRRQTRHADTNFYVVFMTLGCWALFPPAAEMLQVHSRVVTCFSEDGRLTLEE
jgi:hypothetical protein